MFVRLRKMVYSFGDTFLCDDTHNVGVEEVKIDCAANRLTAQGTNMDPMAIKEK